MADAVRMALTEVLRKADAGEDFLRDGVRVLAQALMELEVEQQLGAARHERTPERTGQRNGYRDRVWDTRVGTLDLRVPRVRDGGFVPSLLEPRTRAERALVAVVQEAYVVGVSTRRVDGLVKSLGLDGLSKSQVSRLCADLDTEVARFRTRPLTAAYPYLWLDATFVKARVDGRVSSQAVVIAVGVTTDGVREVLGLDVGPSEDGAFWLGFLRDLVARGLHSVRLVTSDAHEGLRQAIGAVLHGTSWQRCRVHFVRNALALVPKSAQQLVAASIRTAFAEPTPDLAQQRWRQVADGFRDRWPRLADLLDDAEADVLAYRAFPTAHWRQVWSTNPLERLNKELKRRTDVVGIFPNQAAVLRLVGAVLAEQHDEWQVGRKYFSAESLAQRPAREPAALPPPAD
jgi:putative transposase